MALSWKLPLRLKASLDTATSASSAVSEPTQDLRGRRCSKCRPYLDSSAADDAWPADRREIPDDDRGAYPAWFGAQV
jgi:hypothetical protein